MQINQIYHGFKLVDVKEVTEIKAVAFYFVYDKTKTPLFYLQRDDDNKSFVVNKTYTKNTIGNILFLPNYTKDKYDEFYNGIVYINPDDYNTLFNKGTYQMSVYVSDIKKIDDVNKALKDLSYNTLEIKNTLVEDPGVKVLRIVKIIVTTILVVVLFFISYFIIKIILKSRNTYYSVLRMLGASKGACRSLLINELFNFIKTKKFSST